MAKPITKDNLLETLTELLKPTGCEYCNGTGEIEEWHRKRKALEMRMCYGCSGNKTVTSYEQEQLAEAIRSI